jgi:hypothetical protein
LFNKLILIFIYSYGKSQASGRSPPLRKVENRSTTLSPYERSAIAQDKLSADKSQWLHFYFFPFVAFCANALPAALFESLPVLPSLKTFEAAVAAFEDVDFAGALVCASALPAALFDFEAVLGLAKVLEALEAALAPVTFDFVISVLLVLTSHWFGIIDESEFFA